MLELLYGIQIYAIIQRARNTTKEKLLGEREIMTGKLTKMSHYNMHLAG